MSAQRRVEPGDGVLGAERPAAARRRPRGASPSAAASVPQPRGSGFAGPRCRAARARRRASRRRPRRRPAQRDAPRRHRRRRPTIGMSSWRTAGGAGARDERAAAPSRSPSLERDSRGSACDDRVRVARARAARGRAAPAALERLVDELARRRRRSPRASSIRASAARTNIALVAARGRAASASRSTSSRAPAMSPRRTRIPPGAAAGSRRRRRGSRARRAALRRLVEHGLGAVEVARPASARGAARTASSPSAQWSPSSRKRSARASRSARMCSLVAVVLGQVGAHRSVAVARTHGSGCARAPSASRLGERRSAPANSGEHGRASASSGRSSQVGSTARAAPSSLRVGVVARRRQRRHRVHATSASAISGRSGRLSPGTASANRSQVTAPRRARPRAARTTAGATRDAQRGARVAGVAEPAQRGDHVVPLGLQPAEPGALLGAAQLAARPPRRARRSSARGPSRALAARRRLRELLQPVLADRLEHPVARRLGAGDLQQRALGERGRAASSTSSAATPPPARTPRRRRAPRRREDREPAREHALGLVEQVPAPVDHRAQRAVARAARRGCRR